jgi:hypothetical protein
MLRPTLMSALKRSAEKLHGISRKPAANKAFSLFAISGIWPCSGLGFLGGVRLAALALGAALLLRASPSVGAFVFLGRVDGFHPHQNACETDNGIVAGRGLLATHGDALEPLQFAHRLFDPGARPV